MDKHEEIYYTLAYIRHGVTEYLFKSHTPEPGGGKTPVLNTNQIIRSYQNEKPCIMLFKYYIN